MIFIKMFPFLENAVFRTKTPNDQLQADANAFVSMAQKIEQMSRDWLNNAY